jgi:membrane protein DedA with SNARE-associated domain
MDLTAIVHSYGGPALFLWALLQGEAAVIVAGSLAALGYWPWWIPWLLAAIPATLGHQLYFELGRRYGRRLVPRSPALAARLAHAEAMVRDHAAALMVSMRFAYGIRLPLPILCGASGIERPRFFRYNLATALGWSLLFTWCGYGFGTAASAAFARVEHYAAWVLVASLGLGIAASLLLKTVAKRLT